MKLNEVIAQEKVSFEVQKTSNLSFVVVMHLKGKNIGSFGYTLIGDLSSDEARNLAEVDPLYQGLGYGKLLLLKAINTANDANLPFFADAESVTAAQTQVYDSLFDSFYIMQPEYEDQWFITKDGYDYLKASTE